jgi:hypothetical protein
MEWTIEGHRFVGHPDCFYLISTELPRQFGESHPLKHTIMADFDRRSGLWEVRDACDHGSKCASLIQAITSYIDRSKWANRGGQGHCEWMMNLGLPSLEDNLGLIAKQIMDLHRDDPLVLN